VVGAQEEVTVAETARILIVEDDPHLAVILALNLGTAGLDVRVVADGLEALEVFDAWRPMLVILGLGIPTISGFRLIALFKRRVPAMPVIVATALDFEEAVEVARSGADDFLTKPVDPALLLKTVGFHLGRRMPTRPLC
jgi:two-component system, OmpR family, phosphate regulon response regulator PhoB